MAGDLLVDPPTDAGHRFASASAPEVTRRADGRVSGWRHGPAVRRETAKRGAQLNASSCSTDDHHFVAFGVGDPPATL